VPQDQLRGLKFAGDALQLIVVNLTISLGSVDHGLEDQQSL
jgi:hypothetical protein